ncbi:GntR family transcriptional regulator [Oceaniglobus roseus]|uniref:GntR family transcriptional regulator n=1 Tax=Oceaniglobus roseus TaxID=1737570 RepID=UPI000C7F1E6E|nr:GntR family transcriptional regulator [Kandeliimicrobium roseum]
MADDSKTDRRTAAERAYVSVRDSISSGRFAVGERLTEGALAEEAKVSRTPVREALRRLASEGFVTLSPHAGAIVKGWSEKDVRDVFETRALIESHAAGLAARHANAADVQRLAAMAERMEPLARSSPREVMAYSEANRAFHAEILRIAGNLRMEEIALNFMDLGFLVRSYAQFETEDVQRSLSDHRQLVTAIGAGDERCAEAVMRGHILSAALIFRGTGPEAAPRGTRPLPAAPTPEHEKEPSR